MYFTEAELILIVAALATSAVSAATSTSSCPKDVLEDYSQSFERVQRCFMDFTLAKLNSSAITRPGYNASLPPIPLTCKTEADLNSTTWRLVELATPCLDNNTNTLKSHKAFMDFVDFTFNNNSYKDFISNNGLACINEKKIDIKSCYATSTGLVNDTKPALSLIMILNFEKQRGCDEALTMKKCVSNKLISSRNCTSNSNKTLEFITGMFDFATSHCQRNTEKSALSNATPDIPITKAGMSHTTIAIICVAVVVIVACCIGAIVLWRKHKTDTYTPDN